MKKIDLKAPKYVLPLIILPFLFLINWVFLDTFSTGAAPITAIEELDRINSRIPEANLDKEGVSTKFEAIKKAFKNRNDYSAINDLDKKDHPGLLPDEGRYTEEEKMMIDSINNLIMTGEKKGFVEEVKSRSSTKAGSRGPRLSDALSADPKERTEQNTTAAKGTSASNSRAASETPEEREMRLWKEQILMIDSLTKTPEERAAEEALVKKQELLKALAEEKEKEKEKIVNVSKAENVNERHFNTVRKEKKETYIKAIIDEDIKVVDGSRVRIRIMDDIDVGGYLLEKGAYIFATVSSFADQRLFITVESILVDNQIMEVDLTVYDNDGLEGLYVPKSNFTDFTKQLGGNLSSDANIQVESKPGNLNELLFGFAETGIQTGSKATSKAAKRNRARLKYNTIIYLVNPDQI